jgi:hypothetical protein
MTAIITKRVSMDIIFLSTKGLALAPWSYENYISFAIFTT